MIFVRTKKKVNIYQILFTSAHTCNITVTRVHFQGQFILKVFPGMPSGKPTFLKCVYNRGKLEIELSSFRTLSVNTHTQNSQSPLKTFKPSQPSEIFKNLSQSLNLLSEIVLSLNFPFKLILLLKFIPYLPLITLLYFFLFFLFLPSFFYFFQI